MNCFLSIESETLFIVKWWLLSIYPHHICTVITMRITTKYINNVKLHTNPFDFQFWLISTYQRSQNRFGFPFIRRIVYNLIWMVFKRIWFKLISSMIGNLNDRHKQMFPISRLRSWKSRFTASIAGTQQQIKRHALTYTRTWTRYQNHQVARSIGLGKQQQSSASSTHIERLVWRKNHKQN